MSDFITPIFLTPKTGQAHGYFALFLHKLKQGSYNNIFFKFLQQLNEYSERNLVLKLVDDFLLSCSALLITTPTRLISSITLQNLN